MSSMKRADGNRAALLASGIFLLLLLRPALTFFLRDRLQTRDPTQWAQVTTNGSFRLLLPELSASRYHDEALYAARLHQTFVHGLPYNPYWRQERSLGSWFHDCLAFFLLAGVGLLFGGNLTLTWIAAVASLGALWFLLFHAVFKWWCGREAVAMPLALFSILFPDLSLWLLDFNFNGPLNWERYRAVFFQYQSSIRPIFYRLPANFLSLFLLSLLFIATWRLLVSSRSRTFRALGVGIGFGLLALVHSVEHVFAMATLTALVPAAWAMKYPKASQWNLWTIFAGAALTSGVYAVLAALAWDRRTLAESLEWMGLVHSHRFYWITFVHLLFAGFGMIQMRREVDARRRVAWLLLIAAQLAAFLCRNSQVVTGVMIQPFHYIPVGSFLGCLMLSLWSARELAAKRWWTRRVGIVASAVIVLWAAANEAQAARKTYRLFGLPRDMETALDWISRNAPTDSLILSLSMETNETAALYTPAKVQTPPSDPNVSSLFTRDQYFYALAQLLKTSRADVELFLSERMPLRGAMDAASGRLTRDQIELERVDTDIFESAEWFHTYMHGNSSDAPILDGRRRIRELYESAPLVEGPYYLWVNEKDRHLLLQTPESYGGRLLYANPSVHIYGFSVDPKT